jgi:Hsp70 protein
MSWILGIDLGTSFTAAGVVSGQRLEPLVLGAHSSAIPSAVYRSEDDMLFGDAALARGDVDPERLAVEFKRQFGESAPLPSGSTFVAPEELESALGSWVVRRAVELEGSQPSQVVFSFPAFWGAYRRDLFLDIVRKIVPDPDRVVLVTEPEAAAIYYAKRDRLPPGAVVGVYDLGGGTFDASILRKTEDGFEVLGRPAGDDELGGVDVDLVLLRYVIEQSGLTWETLDRDDAQIVRDMMHLRRNVTLAKETLSQALTADVPVAVGTVTTTVHLTRRELEELAAPLIERSLTVFATALSYASVASTDLHSILLVGAASRMPRIAEALRERFNATIALDSHPKFAVCLGAAIWADGGGAELLPPPGSGLPLPPPTGDPAAAAATTAVAAAQPASRRKRRWLLPIAIAGVIVVAAAVVGAIVPLGGGGKPSSATVTVRGDQAWTETSIDVSPGDSVTVEASGTVNLPQAAGPAGDADPALTVFNVKVDGKPLEAPHGSLIGKVGNGAPFVIGEKDTFQVAAAGRLSLGVNDEGVDNNSGSYQASIHVDRH